MKSWFISKQRNVKQDILEVAKFLERNPDVTLRLRDSDTYGNEDTIQFFIDGFENHNQCEKHYRERQMNFHSQSFLLLLSFLLVFIQAQKVNAIGTRYRRQSPISRRKQSRNQTNNKNYRKCHRKMSQRQSWEKVVTHNIGHISSCIFESEKVRHHFFSFNNSCYRGIAGAILYRKKIEQSTQE